jgi:benzodiazapine receptor
MFLFNAACNVGWIFAWHYELTWLTIILMAGILITLSVIYARLSKFNPANSWIEYFGIHFGFSLYLAWILAASILNVFAVATNTEATFNGAAIAGLIIAGILEGSVSLFRLDPVIAFVGCWATAAIAVKQSDAIRTTAIVLAIILGGQGLMIGLWNILAIVKNRRRGWSSKDETLPVGSNETLPGAQKA